MSSYADRIRTLVRKYGKVGLATHLSIYAATFSGEQTFQLLWYISLLLRAAHLDCNQYARVVRAGFYYAAESNLNITHHLEHYGLLSGTAPAYLQQELASFAAMLAWLSYDTRGIGLCQQQSSLATARH